MTREEVLTALALEIHSNGTGRCTGCPLGDDPACTVTLAREALALLKAQEPIEARLHLCESCTKEYPECEATINDIEFGCGVGNDNVIGCTAYVNRWKAQEPRVMTREEYSEWCKMPDCERNPVVIEDRRTKCLVWCWWAAVAPDHDMTVYRIWTAWPTDEQMEAVKWDG